jgi:hypothetical protein
MNQKFKTEKAMQEKANQGKFEDQGADQQAEEGQMRDDCTGAGTEQGQQKTLRGAKIVKQK